MRLYASGFASAREAAESRAAARAKAGGLYRVEIRPRERSVRTVDLSGVRMDTIVTWDVWRERRPESGASDVLAPMPEAPSRVEAPAIEPDAALRMVAKRPDAALEMLMSRTGLTRAEIVAAFALCETTEDAADLVRKLSRR